MDIYLSGREWFQAIMKVPATVNRAEHVKVTNACEVRWYNAPG